MIELAVVSIVFVLIVTFILGHYEAGMFLFGDTDLTYHFGRNFFNFDNIFLWNDYFKAGIFDFDKFQGFYLKKLIFVISNESGLYLFGYLWYFLPMFLFGVTAYFFIKEIIRYCDKKSPLKRIHAMILGILFLVNGIFFIYYGQVLVTLSLVMLNTFLFLYIKNLRHVESIGKNNFGYLVLAGLFFSQINIYLHTLFLLMYAVLILFILNYSFVRNNFRIFIAQAILLVSMTVLLNAQWILPVVSQAFLGDSAIKNLVIYDEQLGWNQARNISNNIFMLDLLRGKSYHIFNNHPALYNFLYIIPIGIVMYFLSKKARKTRFFVYTLLFLVISIFISYGIKPQSEIAYKFLWDHMPFFSAFRTVFKFSFLYLYALVVLLAYILAVTKKGRELYIFMGLIVSCTIISFFYYFQPEVTNNLKQYTVPDYYYHLEEANLSERTKKIGNLITSPQFNWQFQYRWAPDKIDGMNILPYFYGRGVYINGAQDTPDVQYIYNDYFDYQLRNNHLKTLRNLIGLRNIKYVSYQNDLRITEDESTPHIVKSNLPFLPVVDDVFTSEFVQEICSGLKKFGELTFCKINNSLFSPLFKSKNVGAIFINNENYFDYLNEPDYFVPYSRRAEKNFSKVNLVEENPIILNDLITLGISDKNDARIFSNESEQVLGVDFDVKKIVYPSMKPFEVKNCFYQLGCHIYSFQNVLPGKYKIYHVDYLAEESSTAIKKEYTVKIFDDVEKSFVFDNIKNLKSGEHISDYSGVKEGRDMKFLAGANSFIGDALISGGDVILRLVQDGNLYDGRFYLVKEESNQSASVVSNHNPVVEFKKINPVKSRLRIHGASREFPLVFADNFSSNWKLFLQKADWSKEIDYNFDAMSYLLFRENEDDQATVDEIKEFYKSGEVSEVINSSQKSTQVISFISKKINNSIQNDNLPNGRFWETWFTNSVGDERHFIDDGFANGWMLNPGNVCRQNADKCIQNNDGTYDMEIIVEFWPQRALYLGLVLSVLVFSVCAAFVVFYFSIVRGK